MKLLIMDTPDDVACWSARHIVKRINEFQPGPERYFVLGFTTGLTPLKTYGKLIDLHKEGKVSFRHVITFNTNEYVNFPCDHPNSSHSYMYRHFFKHVDINPKNVNVPDGNAADLAQECKLYEKKIRSAGGICLFVGGIGADGSIASNEPGSSLVSRTRVKSLSHETLVAKAPHFDDDVSKVPPKVLTVGVGTVMEAREVLILATGTRKAFALHKAFEEPVNHMWTISAFQNHPNAMTICDEDATAELKVKSVNYYKALNKQISNDPRDKTESVSSIRS